MLSSFFVLAVAYTIFRSFRAQVILHQFMLIVLTLRLFSRISMYLNVRIIHRTFMILESKLLLFILTKLKFKVPLLHLQNPLLQALELLFTSTNYLDVGSFYITGLH